METIHKTFFNKFKHLHLFLTGLIICVSLFIFCNINSFAVAQSGDLTLPLKNFYTEYKFYINLFIGFVLLSNILLFIYHFCRLGAVSTNPQARSKCLNDMLICGVCLALLGGGTGVIYILFFIGN